MIIITIIMIILTIMIIMEMEPWCSDKCGGDNHHDHHHNHHDHPNNHDYHGDGTLVLGQMWSQSERSGLRLRSHLAHAFICIMVLIIITFIIITIISISIGWLEKM